jgi:3-methyladenine DNA glycosylase AlkD
MNSLLNTLELELNKHGSLERSIPMKKYMKNKFEYFGVKSPERKQIFSETLKSSGLPNKEYYKNLVLEMMKHPQREMNYCAIDLAIRCQKKYSDLSDIDYISEMLATRSWWDSVDSIAPHILGKYLQNYPNQIHPVLNKYMASNNMWWHRSCILFQLKYKKSTDEALLFALCEHFKDEKEFFIRKAIGWALREYCRTNAEAVYHFVDNTSLSNLSKREACKHRKDWSL